MKGKIVLGTLLLILAFSLFSGCTQEQTEGENDLNQTMKMPFTVFIKDDFNVLYPSEWELLDLNGPEQLVVAKKGSCTYGLSFFNAPRDTLFENTLMFIDQTKEVSLLASYPESYAIRFAMPLDEKNIIQAKIKMTECNNKTFYTTITCLEDEFVFEGETIDSIFDSIACNEIPLTREETISNTIFSNYQEEDLLFAYPKGIDIPPDKEDEETIINTVYKNCLVALKKHNAIPEQMFAWLTITIDNDPNSTIYEINPEEFELTYSFPNNNQTFYSKLKLSYCNYQTYSVITACDQESFVLNDEIINTTINSLECEGDYNYSDIFEETPTEPEQPVEPEEPETPPEEPESPPEEPEKPAEDDRIVYTTIAQEYGIDAEALVVLINNNTFFRFILAEFPQVNLKIDDSYNDRQIQLKILVNEQGFITRVDDGLYENATLTFVSPIDDVLNIIANADNINFFNALKFVINVKTEPPEMKNYLVMKVLRGGS
ncbi:MAG: hypothetical protein ABH821_05590 [archaeon]